jgi:hypothetical protein
MKLASGKEPGGLKRRIRFEDILAVSHEQGTTTVTGKEATIDHTPYHVGTGRIEEVVSKRPTRESITAGQLKPSPRRFVSRHPAPKSVQF